MASLADFCRENEIRRGYIPMFLAGFAEADIVGTCEKLEDPHAGAASQPRSAVLMAVVIPGPG